MYPNNIYFGLVFLKIDQYTFYTFYSDFASKAACASADLTPACLLLRRIHAQQKNDFFDPSFCNIQYSLTKYLHIIPNCKSFNRNMTLKIFYLGQNNKNLLINCYDFYVLFSFFITNVRLSFLVRF